MQYQRISSNRFRKDLRRLEKSGYQLSKLETVIDLLDTNKPLPAQYWDHELKGQLKGTRECHIAPDWLLMYRKDNDRLLLLLLRTGTHRDVLGIE